MNSQLYRYLAETVNDTAETRRFRQDEDDLQGIQTLVQTKRRKTRRIGNDSHRKRTNGLMEGLVGQARGKDDEDIIDVVKGQGWSFELGSDTLQ